MKVPISSISKHHMVHMDISVTAGSRLQAGRPGFALLQGRNLISAPIPNLHLGRTYPVSSGYLGLFSRGLTGRDVKLFSFASVNVDRSYTIFVE
jgi:hypothetical protein